jgi:hypothetical protein
MEALKIVVVAVVEELFSAQTILLFLRDRYNTKSTTSQAAMKVDSENLPICPKLGLLHNSVLV